MRRQANITEMTDRELRIYKRKLRRQREQRRRLAIVISALFLAFLGTFSYCSLKSDAKSSKDEVMYKYYTRVTLQYGDNVWDLADNYIDYDQYKDKEDYLDEVCSINRLSNCDHIDAGESIVFPYYSSEYK